MPVGKIGCVSPHLGVSSESSLGSFSISLGLTVDVTVSIEAWALGTGLGTFLDQSPPPPPTRGPVSPSSASSGTALPPREDTLIRGGQSCVVG